MDEITFLTGDSRERLAEMPPGSIKTCVTSPPYWGLRDYDHPGQIGAEASPDQYVENLVEIFRFVRNALVLDSPDRSFLG